MGTGAGGQKTRMTGYRADKEVWRYIFSRVDTMHQRDKQADGHLAKAKTALTQGRPEAYQVTQIAY